MKPKRNEYMDGVETANKLIASDGIKHAINQSRDIDWYEFVSEEFKAGFLEFIDHYQHFQEVNREAKKK